MKNLTDLLKANTVETFKDKVENGQLDKLIEAMPDYQFQAGVLVSSDNPRLIEAKGSSEMYAAYGNLKCFGLEGFGSSFNQKIWGHGIGAFNCAGGIYNACEGNNWKSFFRKARYVHARAVASTGGIVQITWFDENQCPIGQFNSLAEDAGVFEVRCDGRWKVCD